MANAEVTIYDAATGKVASTKTPLEIKTKPNEILQLRLNQNQINGSEQVGKDLVIYAEGTGPQNKIVVKDYFDNKVKLIVEDIETGKLSLATAPEGSFTGLAFTSVDSVDQVIDGAEPSSMLSGWVLPILGLAAAVGGGVAISENSGSSNQNANDTNQKPPVVEPPVVEPPVIQPPVVKPPVVEPPVEQASLWDVLKGFIGDQIAHWQNIIGKIFDSKGFKALVSIQEFLGALPSAVGKFVDNGIKGVLEILSAAATWPTKTLSNILKNFGEVISIALKILGDILISVIKLPADFLANPLQAIKSIPSYFLNVKAFIQLLKKTVGDFIDDSIHSGKSLLNNLATILGDLVKIPVDILSKFFSISPLGLLSLPFDLVKAVVSIIGGVISTGGGIAKVIPEAFKAFFSGGIGIGSFIKDAFGFVAQIFSKDGFIGGVLESIKNTQVEIFKSIFNYFFDKDSILGKGIKLIDDVMNQFIGKDSFIAKTFNAIKDVVNGLVGKDSFIGKIFTAIKDAVVNTLFGKDSIIGKTFTAIKDVVNGLIGKDSFIGKIFNTVKDVVAGVVGKDSFIGKTFTAIKDMLVGEDSLVGKLFGVVKDTVSSLFEDTLVGKLFNNVKDTIVNIFESLLAPMKMAPASKLVSDDTHINLEKLLPASDSSHPAPVVAEKSVAVNATSELLSAMNDHQYHVA